MPSWIKFSTNVYEVGIEDAASEVPQDRSGMLALSSNPQFVEVLQRKKHQLSCLTLDSYSFITEGKKQKTTVYIKFNVKDDAEDECEFSFRAAIIQEGKFITAPLPKEFIHPNADKELRQLAVAVSGHISHHFKGSVPSKHPIDMVMDKIVVMLQTDYDMMRDKIRSEADKIRTMDEVRQKAWDAYYVSIRDQLQKTVSGFPGMRPEDLHRMIDEIVCIQMHNE